jgi:hypothetical protein
VLQVPPGIIYPGSAIVPIFRFNTGTGQTTELLGTGFFIDGHGSLMSVKHVLGVQPGPGEAIGIQLVDPGGGRGWIYKLGNVRSSDRYDLAIAEVPDAVGFQVLQICQTDPQGIPELLMWDYSTGYRGGWLPDGTEGLRLIPYMWHGTWLATYMALEPGMTHPARIIDVPFPGMRGASGSPIIERGTTNVVGILFGNVARQLIPPPQIADQGQPWYLPVGQALHCQHLREFVNG